MTFRTHAPLAEGVVARLCLLIFLDGFAHSVSFPILPRLVAELTGHQPPVTALWVGWLEVAWAVPQILIAPVLGALSDRYGRRPLMLLSAVGIGIELTLDALASHVGWLVVGRVVCGLSFAAQAAVMAGVADVTATEGRARAFGLANGALYGGIVAGLLASGALASLGVRAPFWTGAGVAAAAALYVALAVPEPLGRAQRTVARTGGAAWEGVRLVAAYPGLRPLALVLLLSWLAFQSSDNMVVLYTEHRYGWSAGQFGLFAAATALLGIAVQGLLASPATRRLGERGALVAGSAMTAAGMLAMGLAPAPAAFVPAAMLAMLGAVARPALQAMMSRCVGADEQGRLQGLVSSIVSLTSVVAPLAFTSLYAWAIGGGRAPAWAGLTFVCGATLSAIAALVAWRRR
jgi:DHA1 family tetracycline resistance protein-like MFS transporter